MLSLRSLLFFTSLFVLMSQAFAGPYSASPHLRPPAGPFDQTLQLKEDINQYFSSRGIQAEVLGVLQTFQLNRSYPGYQVKKVILKGVSSANGMGTAQLRVNGEIQQEQTIPSYYSDLNFTFPAAQNEIQGSLNGAQVLLRGDVYVHQMAVELAGADDLYVDTQRFREFFNGQSQIPVAQQFRLMQNYRGQELKFVELRAALSRQARVSDIATVQLFVNGQAVGHVQQLDGHTQQVLRFELPPYLAGVIGADINAVQLRMRGQIETSELSIGIVSQFTGNPVPRPRPTPAPAPRPPHAPSEVALNVNQVVRGDGALDLQRFVRDRQLLNRQVRSVRVEATSMSNFSRLRVCATRANSRLGCSAYDIVGGSDSVLQLPSGARLSDVRLETRGDVQIRRVIVQF